ncbi:hypothetical protein [Hyphomicrobium sp. 99]|uniref:hypothetical protein n=1 Tax=Hyphomicrobium sp. 99 TaxID=1163419 RepID=UPI0012DFFD58|nr:hypothetical protein [Hyphomicrobium sp. 99]
MTIFEMYYLVLCLAAFAVFAIALASNAWSWRQSPAKVNSATAHSGYREADVKLAA